MHLLKNWLAVLTSAAVIALAVLWSERVPAVVPASAPAAEFSAERAWTTLSMLADTIGLRVTGTRGADRALEYLTQRVREIPGVEVEIQDVTGTRSVDANVVIGYRTKNLLVRVPGNTRDAVLVSSHYDSPTSSVGAVDAGVPVAAMVEMIRNLASGPRLPRSVIFNINGAEEQGLLGAHGFLRHPWMRDARVFIDLESAGTANKAILFQTGPGHAWIAKEYAAVAPHPYGTVLGQDLFQSGAIPSATDFEIYRDGPGIPGVDIAFFRNGFAYHTQLDRTWNVQPGSLQHMGANALALTRALATAEIPASSPRRAVYYDVLGVLMLTYADTTAVVLAVLATLLAVAAVIYAVRRLQLRARDIGFAFGVTLATWLVGLALAVLVALLPPLAGKPHSWFTHPVLPFSGYALLAVAPLLLLHGWMSRRRAADATRAVGAAWAGALLFMVLMLLLLTILDIGSAYLMLWWVAPTAAGLLAFAKRKSVRLLMISLWPGALFTMQAGVLLLEFRAIGGRMPLAVPFDVVMAAIVALLTLLLCTIPIAAVHTAPWSMRTGAIAAGVGILAIALGALRFPYSELRPQRLAVSQHESPDSAVVRVTGIDYVGPRVALAGFPNARVLPSGSARRGPYVINAPHSGLLPAEVTLLSSVSDSATGNRKLSMRVAPSDAYANQLSLSGDRFVRWIPPDSIGSSGAVRPRSDAIAQLIGTPDTGWTIGVVVRGNEPIALQATAVRAVTTAPVADFVARLPKWTTSYATAQTRRTFTF